MPAVFVHGNPETSFIWGQLVALLDRDDVITLSPPGFGVAVPDGFGGTSDDYRDWLIAELEAIDGPIDLVGHDWGGGHVVRAVDARPDLVRSWASDVMGLFDPDYVWHDNAQIWQTDGEGEEAVAAMVEADNDDLTALYESLGMDSGTARSVAEALNEDMAAMILSLYRSARQPILAELGADLSGLPERPGLAIIASEDPYVGGEVMNRRVADRVGAKPFVLEGLGHWWMMQAADRGAAMLEEFWAGLD